MGRLARLRPWALVEAWVAAFAPHAALAGVRASGAPCCFRSSWSPSGCLRGRPCICWQERDVLARQTCGHRVSGPHLHVTKPGLMQIGWFERTYHRFIPWKDAAEGWLRKSWAWRAGRVVKYRATSGLKQWPRAASPGASSVEARAPVPSRHLGPGPGLGPGTLVAAREVSEAAVAPFDLGRGHF